MDKEINLTKLREHLPLLEAKWQDKDDATTEYNAAVDAVSAETGAEKAVLKKLVTAIKKEKSENAKAEADELSDLIDAVGC
jgi:phytoene/squalene synthetase